MLAGERSTGGEGEGRSTGSGTDEEGSKWKLQREALVKPEPEMLTTVPPLAGPAAGVREVSDTSSKGCSCRLLDQVKPSSEMATGCGADRAEAGSAV